MKRLRFILPVAIIAAVMLLATPVLADGPSTVEVDWDGAGWVTGNTDTGDSNASFYSGGNHHTGEFKATDQNNNPYSYNVDTCNFSLDTDITGGGQAWLEVNRVESKTSSYGPGGQQSFAYIITDDGDASLQNRSTTNFASMRDCNYSWNSNDHITVSNATNYELWRYMDGDVSDASLNLIDLWAGGSGSADLDCMSSEASGGRVKLGHGCGCYTNADFTATGSGQFQLYGRGDDSATTQMAPGMTGASSFNFIANWLGGSTFTVPDYSTTVE